MIPFAIRVREKTLATWPALWQTFSAQTKKWLHAPEPLTDDLPWWAPQRRRAMLYAVGVAGLFTLAGMLFVRYLDAEYDDPNKYEQIYYLNNTFSARKNAIVLESNVFGKSPAPELATRARLLRIHGENGKVTNWETLSKNFITLSPAEIRAQAPMIRIAKLPQQHDLAEAFATMAKAQVVRAVAQSAGHGVVYSFDLEMEILRGDESLGLYEETFHLRGDTFIEKSTVFLVCALFALAGLFIADFSGFVFDVRWGKYFKAVAGQCAEILYYLKRLAELVIDFSDVQPVLGNLVANALRKLLEQLLQQIEQKILGEDDNEVRELRNMARVLLQRIEAQSAHAPTTETEFSIWQQDLLEVMQRTEAMHKRLQFLGKRPRRFHGKTSRHLPPISMEQLQQAIALVENTGLHARETLNEALAKVNAQRNTRREQHHAARAQCANALLARIRTALQHQELVSDMNKLGKPFPRSRSALAPFATPDARTEGKTTVVEGEESLYYEAFAFAVHIASESGEAKLWLEISKEGEEYRLAQAQENARLKIPPPPLVAVAASNDKDQPTPVRYTVLFKPHRAFAQRDTLQFELVLSDIALLHPQPDPEQWFEAIPLEELAKKAKRKKKRG